MMRGMLNLAAPAVPPGVREMQWRRGSHLKFCLPLSFSQDHGAAQDL